MTSDLGEQVPLGAEYDSLRLVELAALGGSAVRIGQQAHAGPLEETVSIEKGLLTREDIPPVVGGFVYYMLHPTPEGLSLVNQRRALNGQESITLEG